jgi:hypothetical protein
MKWEPITESELEGLIAYGLARMSRPERRLWEFIRVPPTKWELHPWGDEGGGFWVVALTGNKCIYFNDIEWGFNSSTFSNHGVIDQYLCSQGDLHPLLQSTMNWILAEPAAGGHSPEDGREASA